jgi:hypothetical protein
MSLQKLLQGPPLVGGRIIQRDDERTARMAQQLPKKQANFLLPDIVEVKLILRTQVLSAGTYGDSVVISLQAAPLGFLWAPMQAVQQTADMIPMVMNSELAIDQLRNASGRRSLSVWA